MATAVVEERQLLKAMTWWDGFVVALANPGFLIAALGALDRRARDHRARSCCGRSRSASARCRTTSTPSWRRCSRTSPAASRCTRTRRGASTSRSSARWRRSATGSAGRSCSSINGLVAGTLIQSEWFSGTTWDDIGAGFDLIAADPASASALILLVWLFNVFGVRPAVWFGYVTGGAAAASRCFVLMFLPYITGDWSSSNMQWNIGSGGGLRARDHLAVLHVLVVLRDRGRGDVRARVPRHRDATRRGRCARRRCSASRSTRCCRSASAARWGRRRSADDPTFIAFYTQAFDELVGNALGNVMIFCIVAGLVLSMNTATMDGSRALYGIAQGRDDDQAARDAQQLPRARDGR